MAQTHPDHIVTGADHVHGAGRDRGRAHHEGRQGQPSQFWRHFLEMVGAMVAGMFVTGAIFVSVVGLTSWDEVTTQYPTQVLLAMAVGMTVPMVAWMRHRGMGWRSSYEMAAAMVLPVIPFLCLVWFGVTQSAPCGAYCAVMVAAMYVLMRYRRDEYAHH